MKIIKEIGLLEFETWCGATYTKKIIIDSNKEEQFNYLIEELYPNGISETQLNDLLWFENEWLFEVLEIEQ